MKMQRFRLLLCLLAVLCVCASAALPVLADRDTFVYDETGVLTSAEREALETMAAQFSYRYDCGIYAAIIYDYRAYTSGVSIESAASAIYRGNEFGLGDDSSGVFLLLSMSGRDYDIAAYGYGNEAFTDYGKEILADAFKDNFRRDDWYGGLSDYIEQSGDMLEQARNGEPLDISNDAVHATVRSIPLGTRLLVIVGIPCLIALIACSFMKQKMKSVAKASNARFYAVPHSLNLTESSDVFSHVTETRVKIESDSDRSDGGGGTSVGSDGFSHSSGKF